MTVLSADRVIIRTFGTRSSRSTVVGSGSRSRAGSCAPLRAADRNGPS